VFKTYKPEVQQYNVPGLPDFVLQQLDIAAERNGYYKLPLSYLTRHSRQYNTRSMVGVMLTWAPEAHLIKVKAAAQDSDTTRLVVEYMERSNPQKFDAMLVDEFGATRVG